MYIINVWGYTKILPKAHIVARTSFSALEMVSRPRLLQLEFARGLKC